MEKCLTCGAECEIGGEGLTHYYIPKTDELRKKLDKAIIALNIAFEDTDDMFYKNIIGEINELEKTAT